MDKFLELPLPQKLLVMALLLAVIGGGFYFLLIQPEYDEADSYRYQLRRYIAEYNKLKQFDSKAFKEEIAKERKAFMEKKKSYEKLLPTKEELPEFIESLKQDADSAGLELLEFNRLPKNIPGPNYVKIPITIKVKGKYSQLLAFLDALSSPTKRLINIEDFSITAKMPSFQKVEEEIGDMGLLRVLKEKAKIRPLTPAEEQARQLILYEEASRRTTLEVSMSAYVFMYTGK